MSSDSDFRFCLQPPDNSNSQKQCCEVHAHQNTKKPASTIERLKWHIPELSCPDVWNARAN